MKKIIVITGPTGTGKTKLSLELAKKYNAEIINADSTQIYKGMNIATAKIKDKEGIIHHLMDIKEITEAYSIYDYQKDARKCIDEIHQKGKTVIFVGGTGLYIKAALFDYKFSEEVKQNYDMYSNEELYELLKEKEPNTNIHPNNRKRIERALSRENSDDIGKNTLLYDTIFIGLTANREILYDKINQRVDDMVSEGLLNESENIYKSGIRSKAVLTPIGYKELFPYFEGKESLDNCLDKIKQNSRRYAKRQYTFFRHQMNITWIEVDYEHFENTIKKAISVIEK